LDFSINRSSAIPYYVQVKDTIQAHIHAGTWQPGDQLPGEPELCRMFSVSRTVIRQALNDLVNKGFLIREKGKGTFVAQPKIRESLVQKLTGFYQDMVEQGHTPRTQVLRQESTPASRKVADYLQITPGTPVIAIERLRFVQEIPIQLVTTYIPFSLCSALLNVDLSNQSLYAFLEQTCGVTMAWGHRSIEAVPANDYEAHLLRVQRGAPLILLDSVSFLSDGTAAEYYHALHRGDRTRFEVELIRVEAHGDRDTALAQKYGNYPPSSGVILPPKKSGHE
jgi:GntR family transcriptional regulator